MSDVYYQLTKARHDHFATDKKVSLLLSLRQTPGAFYVGRQLTWSDVNAMTTTCRQEMPVSFPFCLQPHSINFYDADTRVNKCSRYLTHKQHSTIYGKSSTKPPKLRIFLAILVHHLSLNREKPLLKITLSSSSSTTYQKTCVAKNVLVEYSLRRNEVCTWFQC